MPLSPMQIEFMVDEETLQDIKAVHAFLKANLRLAYSPDEVAKAVLRPVHLVARMLEKFDDLDLVWSGVFNDKRYFRYLADLPDLD